MSSKEQKTVVLTHSDKLFEADMLVSALKDAGIPAYHTPAKSAANTVIPQSMGLSENGYDICVLESKADRAHEVLNGITVTEETEQIEESSADDNGEVPEYVVPETSVEKQKGEAGGAGIGATILTLAAVAAAVWLSDMLIAWVQSLLGCA